MKTIDTRSLLLGAALSVLFLTLTSSKTSSDIDDLEIFARGATVDVFNKKTNTIYEYDFNMKGKISNTPLRTYKISTDGSSITTN